MHLDSLIFILFVAIVATVYHLLGQRWKKYWLLAASYFFYESWSTQMLFSLIFFTLTNYALGILISRSDRKQRLLILGIVFNCVFLLLLKYVDFFVPSLNGLLGRFGLATPSLLILLPLGLSYLVLQAIGYLVDVARQEIEPETDFVYFAAYLAYFPKVISGPIESARQFIPRLKAGSPISAEYFGRGVFLFLEGLFRKRVLADLLWALDPYRQIFADAEAGKLTMLAWVLVAMWALYSDFSGYSNMARGISYFFGIELSINFRTPLLAGSMTDYWSRWHISFSSWLREYIFFPLSRVMIGYTRNSRNALNFMIPIVVTMAVSALWHDIALDHALWAGIIAVVLILEQYQRTLKPRSAASGTAIWQRVPTVALLIALNPAFFNNFSDTVSIWGRFAFDAPLTLDTGALRALWLIIPAFLNDWMHYRTDDEFWLLKMRWGLGALIAAAALIALFVVSLTELNIPTFVYQTF